MAETEIGTDSAATLYAQGESIRATAERIAEGIITLPEILGSVGASQLESERILASINDSLNSLTVAVDNQTDMLVSIRTIQDAHIEVSRDTRGFATASAEGIAYTRELMEQYRDWITPLLDDFHKSAILPTMSKILAKVNHLDDSHTEIKGIAKTVQDQVEPMLDALSKSPLLSMLGVKRDKS